MAGSNHFSVLVVGDDPKKIISKYNASKKGKKRVVYEFAKKEEYLKKKIATYEQLLQIETLGQAEREYFQEELNEWKKMSAEDFYWELTSDYELDEEGNAISDSNPDGRYTSYSKANKFSQPFVLKNGRTSFSAKKGDIDWSKTHLADKRKYEVAWDTVIEHRKPKNNAEEEIFRNMERWDGYLRSFETKDNYVRSCTSFWQYAVATKDEWTELEGNKPQFEWVKDFYDKFIVPLSNDTLLTIYECVRALT